ncbi:MAG: hypothetical protein Q8K45_19385 [Rubrivivax sp.]|nr:hypothetical protein [Rubrivivax sp.]
MKDQTPADTVAFHVVALMRGQALPSPLSRDAEMLRQAMRCMLASSAYPRAVAADRNNLALLILLALNDRLRADAMALSSQGKEGNS